MTEVCTLAQGFSNAFLIKDKRTIMVDTGIGVSKEKYLELFKQQNVDPQTISLIVISHGHADHFGQASLLQKMTQAPVLCHKNAINALRSGKNALVMARNDLGKKVLKMIKRKIPMPEQSVEPNLLMEEKFDLNSYGVAGKIIYTPGHTDCSVSVLLDSGEAIVGDIFVPSFFTGEPCIAYFANNEAALLESVKKLLNCAHTFYCGHGGPYVKSDIITLEKQ